VSTFLKLIGRSLKEHASKFESWEDLFTSSPKQLKSRGLEPARSRKYLLRWREKFRRGEYGVGGDLKFVSDGVGELRVFEVPRLNPDEKLFATISHTPGTAKLIVNVPPGSTSYKDALAKGETSANLTKPKGLTLKEGRIIRGSHVIPAKGGMGDVATIKVTEGMWEHKLGRKVFGGERRRAEVLHKLAVEKHRKETR
jgi:hypothetical protein